MRKFWLASLVLIILLGIVAVLYFDFFNLKYKREAAIASIISDEDHRMVTERLIRSLSDPDPEIRKFAATAVGRIGHIAAVEKLFNLVNDSSGEVAEAAIFGIGLSGEKSYAVRLLNYWEDLSPELLAVMIQSVGRLSDSTMTDIIDDMGLFLEHLDHRVREQTAYALWRAGAKSYSDALINLCRNDPVRPVRIAALYALVRLGAGEPTDLYAEWLPDSDPYVRSLAFRGLGLSKAENVVSLIASGLNDRSNNVVSQAITSLTGIGGDRVVRYLTSRYINETDEKIKAQLLRSFTKLNSDAIVDYAHDDIQVAQMYSDKDDKTKSDSTSIGIRTAAIIYLAKIKGEEIMPLIDSMAIKRYPYLFEGLADALGQIGGESVKPRLMSFLKDSPASVRAAAFNALCTVDTANLDYYLKTALADEDFVVVEHAVEKIGELRLDKYMPQLMTLMKMSKNNEADLKRSIVTAAGNFLDDEVNTQAEELLFLGLMENEYLVSREAAIVYQEKLNIDKTAYINLPYGLLAKSKIKSLLRKYKENPHAIIFTNRGEIEMELYFDVAPLTVYNFMKLAHERFYDNLAFHQVVPNFVIQGGDPRNDGWGGPGYSIRCEYNNVTFGRGCVGMAHSAKDNGGSQFFITLSPQPHLDARYTLFGKVTKGMDVVDRIVKGDIIESVLIVENKDDTN